MGWCCRTFVVCLAAGCGYSAQSPHPGQHGPLCLQVGPQPRANCCDWRRRPSRAQCGRSNSVGLDLEGCQARVWDGGPGPSVRLGWDCITDSGHDTGSSSMQSSQKLGICGCKRKIVAGRKCSRATGGNWSKLLSMASYLWPCLTEPAFAQF